MRFLDAKKAVATVAVAGGLIFGLNPTAMAAGTVKVGMSTALSGIAAPVGLSDEHGVQLAIDRINAEGGLLGKKIELVTADGETKPATGVGNVRHFILQDHVKAIFDPTASDVAAAEDQAAARFHTLIFFSVSNDVDMTGKYFSKYTFQVVPSTYMEPHGLALYVARLAKKNHWKTIYTIAPNYSFGHATVETFLTALKGYGANLKLVGQQWPPLGASDFTQYINAIMSKHPDFVFSAQYGGDLITFTKQAEGVGFFKKTHILSLYVGGVLTALGEKAPAGALALNRAPPFYTLHSKVGRQFVEKYHEQFHKWPTLWSVLGYSGLQTWAQGVKKAGSFDADKVSAALSGATVQTLRGPLKIRACDHLAESPEFAGVLSEKVNPEYGIRTMTHIFKAPAEKIMMSCKDKIAMRQS